MATILGRIIAIYFIVYPIVFFLYNWVAPQIPLPKIPGFWLGMACFFLIIFVKNVLFGNIWKK